jgi:hypothetical protein
MESKRKPQTSTIWSLSQKPKIYTGEKTASSTYGVRKIWVSACRRLILDLYFWPCTKINSKWMKDVNIKCKNWKYYRKSSWRFCYGNLKLRYRKQHFIVPAQTQQTRVQRLSLTTKGSHLTYPCKQVTEAKGIQDYMQFYGILHPSATWLSPSLDSLNFISLYAIPSSLLL